jgi:hypothetical protein
MKKIIILILAALAFSWTPVVSAEQSPESVVTCVSAGAPYFIYSKSISGAINEEQCQTSSPDHTCSPCISSLEDQGCKLVDVVVENVAAGETELTYLLSCVAP